MQPARLTIVQQSMYSKFHFRSHTNVEGVSVAIVKVPDRADEFRIEVSGRFAGECVDEIAQTWKAALRDSGRRFTVDISRLSSYDYAGRKLLHEMYRHGTQIAARTPASLVFLNEISTPPRRGPTLVAEPASRRRNAAEPAPTPAPRALAAGQ